jgi:hypothetical protein
VRENLTVAGTVEVMSPIRHEVINIDGADAGGEVPAACCLISRRIRGVRGRQYPIGPRRGIAIVVFSVLVGLARNIIVARNTETGPAGKVNISAAARRITPVNLGNEIRHIVEEAAAGSGDLIARAAVLLGGELV